MNPNDPNVSLLERAAEQLGEALLEQLVFVGGAVAGVLITDPAMPEIRPTQDVDVICSVIARSDYHQLGRQLRQRGFQEDSRPGAPLCRWCTDDLILDLMPTQGQILGFSNRWYPLALETAQFQELPSGLLDPDRDGPGVPGHQAGGLSRSRPGQFSLQSRPGRPDGGGRRPCLAAGGMQAQPA